MLVYDIQCMVISVFLAYSIEGGELFDRVIDDEFVLTEKTCTILIRQLCEAMEFIHSNNILHLDLKPENILCLTREGNRIKVIDFGLARRYDPDKKLQVSKVKMAFDLSIVCGSLEQQQSTGKTFYTKK